MFQRPQILPILEIVLCKRTNYTDLEQTPKAQEINKAFNINTGNNNVSYLHHNCPFNFKFVL